MRRPLGGMLVLSLLLMTLSGCSSADANTNPHRDELSVSFENDTDRVLYFFCWSGPSSDRRMGPMTDAVKPGDTTTMKLDVSFLHGEPYPTSEEFGEMDFGDAFSATYTSVTCVASSDQDLFTWYPDSEVIYGFNALPGDHPYCTDHADGDAPNSFNYNMACWDGKCPSTGCAEFYIDSRYRMTDVG